MVYARVMSFVEWLLLKAIALVVIVFVVNLIYAAVTGKSIAQARRDRGQG